MVSLLTLDAIFHNGRFRTLEADRPVVTRIGVLGGVIVGFDEELDGCRAEREHDLGGAHVVPGFHDAHHHLSARGQTLSECDVSPSAVRDLDALYARLAAFASTLPPDAWVRAHGYDDRKLGGTPERAALDRACGGRPLWMLHSSHHHGMVNTEAMRRMGHDDPRNVPDVAHGYVQRDADGAATGFLAEQALHLVGALIRPEPLEQFVAAIAAGSAAALADGLTSITEPGICGLLTGNGAGDLGGFQIALEHGLLEVRTTVMPEISMLHELTGDAPGGAGYGLDLGLRTGLGDDRLRLGAVKIFSDGALTARTAAMREDFTDRPGDRGQLFDDAATITAQIVDAHRAGWQVATHAIGDRAIDVVLDAYEQAQTLHPRPDPRHRIEHCGVTHDDQIARLVALGVLPVPQGRFLSELGDSYVDAVGAERSALLYRQRSFLSAGLPLPGSSDCPVVNGAPLLGVHALVNRELPDGTVLNPAEALSVEQAVRAFTLGSAYADRKEARKGSLRRGKLADFTVLSEDLWTVAPDRIREVQVVATVVGGRVAYQR